MLPESGSRRTRILHVTFNMGIGGTEQVIRQLVLHLPDTSFESRILCIDGHIGETGTQLQKLGIEVFSLKRKPGFDWKLIFDLRSMIRQQGISIVHCHQYTPWVYGLLASVATGARVVFTEHGRFHPDHYRYKAIVANPLFALMTHRIIAISAATRAALARYEFIPKSAIGVIYNGIGGFKHSASARECLRKHLGIPSDAFVMGTVARLDPVKNQSMMLEAFSLILARHPDSWLLMVGDGPDRNLLVSKARELGVGSRVCFTGFIEDPSGYLAAMDVFLLSSHTEGTSMTLLEAMSLGIPGVVTNTGGNPEIIEDGHTGILCEPGSAPGMASAIEKIYRSSALAQSLSVNSRRRYQDRFSVDQMIQSYCSVYLDSCGTSAE